VCNGFLPLYRITSNVDLSLLFVSMKMHTIQKVYIHHYNNNWLPTVCNAALLINNRMTLTWHNHRWDWQKHRPVSPLIQTPVRKITLMTLKPGQVSPNKTDSLSFAQIECHQGSRRSVKHSIHEEKIIQV